MSEKVDDVNGVALATFLLRKAQGAPLLAENCPACGGAREGCAACEWRGYVPTEAGREIEDRLLAAGLIGEGPFGAGR